MASRKIFKGMKKQLIVNADDYGHSRGTSQGIRQGHLNGIITSTTAMINYPGADGDLRVAMQECPHLGLGLHLVLTSGNPVLSPEKVPSLVNEKGRFFDLSGFYANEEHLNLKEVEAEWRAQIEAFQKAIGRKPDHLDSHHHSSYCNIDLFLLMMDLADELNCSIRVPYGTEHTVLANISTPPEQSRLAGLKNGYAQVFIDDFYDQTATLESMKGILQFIAEDSQHQTFELMCHPAIVDEELTNTSSYNQPRARELEVLTSPEIVEMVKQKDIQLISFEHLMVS
jgi:chitin disaccharide deacetylase